MILRPMGPLFCPDWPSLCRAGVGVPSLALCPRGTNAHGYSWSNAVHSRSMDHVAVWKECRIESMMCHQDGKKESLRVPPAKTLVLSTYSVASPSDAVRSEWHDLPGQVSPWNQRQGSSGGCQSRDRGSVTRALQSLLPAMPK